MKYKHLQQLHVTQNDIPTNLHKLSSTLKYILFMFTRRNDSLEGVIAERLHKVLNTSLMSGATLHQKSTSSPHSKTSIGNLLCLKTLDTLRTSLQVSKRIQTKVTGLTNTILTSRSGSNTRKGFNEHNHNQRKGNVLRVRVPKLPEGIHLALGSGSFTSRSRSKDFNLKDSSNGKHGHTCMLDFGFTEPVEVNAEVIDVGKAKGIESNVTGHASIEKSRTVHKWKCLTLFCLHGNSTTLVHNSGSKGGSSSKKSSSSKRKELHGGYIYICMLLY
mmetsp:Transcript_3015/g.4152  ORF Transcript_3015/g.4152 Transcript_3015/m.4152 type:complete len:274 (-) Transcript_3015:77-898(-)